MKSVEKIEPPQKPHLYSYRMDKPVYMYGANTYEHKYPQHQHIL